MAGFSHVSGDISSLRWMPSAKPAGRSRLVAKADEGFDVKARLPCARTDQDGLFRKSASKIINLLIQRTTEQKAMGDYGCTCYAPIAAYYRYRICAAMNAAPLSLFTVNIFRSSDLPDRCITLNVNLAALNTVLCVINRDV